VRKISPKKSASEKENNKYNVPDMELPLNLQEKLDLLDPFLSSNDDIVKRAFFLDR